MDFFDLQDMHRVLNQDKTLLTWSRSKHRTRLDNFFISNLLANSITHSSIEPCSLSDRYYITITSKLSNNRDIKGKGFLKRHTSLLKDQEYNEKIRETINLL